MTTGSRTHCSHDPADVASLLRLLAEAADSRSFFATLCRSLPHLLPAIRVDLLGGQPSGGYVSLAGAGSDEPSEQIAQSVASFGEWLGDYGYSALDNLGSVNTKNEALVCVIFVILVALVFDAVFVVLRRFTTPRGSRA